MFQDDAPVDAIEAAYETAFKLTPFLAESIGCCCPGHERLFLP